METLFADRRFALRALRRAPAYAGAAIDRPWDWRQRARLLVAGLVGAHPFPMVAEPHRLAAFNTDLSEGVRLVLVGLFVGIALALGAARLVANQLLGVSAVDVPTFAMVAVLLLAVALLATWLPARRAARFDPAEALRS